MLEEETPKQARLVIHISQEDRLALLGLARRARTSPAMLAKLGIAQLLLRSREAEPLIAPSTVKEAVIPENLNLKPVRKKKPASGSLPTTN